MKLKENLMKLKNVLLIIGVVLIGIGGIFTLNFNYVQTPVNETNVNLYTLNAGYLKHPIYDILPVRIDATLSWPKLENDFYALSPEGRPAIVFVHGFTADKTYFRGLAQEFGKRGFVCLSITARGHGASGGVVGLTWENETLTAVDYLEMLADSKIGIDKNRIGLIGHSMGAFSVTLAASLDSRINATVAIGGPLVNITRGFGFASILSLYNITSGPIATLFDLRTIMYLMPGITPYLQYPIYMPWALENAMIQGKVNGTNPKNYLNVIGTIDEAFSVYSAQEVLWYMGLKDSPYNIPHYIQVLRNNLYGEFNGTARKLTVLPLTDHITEQSHPACAYEALNWMEKSMKLTHPAYGNIENWIYQFLFRDSISESIRSNSPFLIGIGLLFTFIPVSIYLGNWLKSKYTEAKVAKNIENKKMWLNFLIYGLVFSIISLITVPVIGGLKIVPWTDYLGTNILHMLLCVQSLLLLPALIVLIIYERWKYKESWEDFGIHPKALFKSAIFGILMSLFVFFIGTLATTWTFFDSLPYQLGSLFEIFVTMIFTFSVTELLFRGLIQTKLSRYENVKLKFVSRFLPSWKEFLLSSLVTGIIQGIGMGIVASMFLNSISLIPIDATFVNLMMFGQFSDIPQIPNIPLPLMVIGGCIGFCFLLSLVMNWLYRKSRNITGLIIFSAFVISWLSTITPLISGSII